MSYVQNCIIKINILITIHENFKKNTQIFFLLELILPMYKYIFKTFFINKVNNVSDLLYFSRRY